MKRKRTHVPCPRMSHLSRGQERKAQIEILRDLYQDYGKDKKKTYYWYVNRYNRDFADKQ